MPDTQIPSLRTLGDIPPQIDTSEKRPTKTQAGRDARELQSGRQNRQDRVRSMFTEVCLGTNCTVELEGLGVGFALGFGSVGVRVRDSRGFAVTATDGVV